jgi:hypothetical protein
VLYGIGGDSRREGKMAALSITLKVKEIVSLIQEKRIAELHISSSSCRTEILDKILEPACNVITEILETYHIKKDAGKKRKKCEAFAGFLFRFWQVVGEIAVKHETLEPAEDTSSVCLFVCLFVFFCG